MLDVPRVRCVDTTPRGEESRERPTSTVGHQVGRGAGAGQGGLGRTLRHPR